MMTFKELHVELSKADRKEIQYNGVDGWTTKNYRQILSLLLFVDFNPMDWRVITPPPVTMKQCLIMNHFKPGVIIRRKGRAGWDLVTGVNATHVFVGAETRFSFQELMDDNFEYTYNNDPWKPCYTEQ